MENVLPGDGLWSLLPYRCLGVWTSLIRSSSFSKIPLVAL